MILIAFTSAAIGLISIFFLYFVFMKKMQYWIFSDMKRGLLNFVKSKPKDTMHIMFAFVDHFEPGNRNAGAEQQKSRVSAWLERYPDLASRHWDNDGICPQHTFFFPPHYDTHDHLEKIVELCSQGYGEVETHLHHDRQPPWPDDEASLEKKIKDCISSFTRHDVFCLPNGQKAYGFIHGDWDLANSLKGENHCGVNNELSILKNTGCYADFTFPVCNESQPKLANTIFYAQTGLPYPKSYDIRPIPAQKGRKPPKDSFMLIQGVIGLRWRSRTHRFIPSIEQSNIDASDFPFDRRIDYWINKKVHVKGRPNWIFVKIHTHGAREEDRTLLLGKDCDDMYTFLEEKYNDSKKFFLHYVSAREMYNIVKATEAGENGNPNGYRDYVIPRYVYLQERKNSRYPES